MHDQAKPTQSRKLKYDASRMDIVNTFYDEVQRLLAKYAFQREAILALDEVELLAIWWANTPAVVRPSDRDWLPIQMAPRDGTVIRARAPSWSGPMDVRFNDGEWQLYPLRWLLRPPRFCDDPTEWQERGVRANGR